jgi:voltage-gated potassium channel
MATPKLSTARAELVRRLEHWLELPMVILGAIWLGLLVVELVGYATAATDLAGTVIWIVFVIEYAFRLAIAPHKGLFLRRHWVTALSLALPALRVLRIARIVRILRAGRAVRAVRVARILTSFNRGMRALGSTMQSRGFPYAAALTVVVLLLGAAGMYTFERDVGSSQGFHSFGAALWWTAMLLTTMGSEYWPRTPEGRFVCLLLSIYAFAVFGYITATLASFFIGSDSEGEKQRADRLELQLARIHEALDDLRTRGAGTRR